ncbi:orotidine 5'-phosphate decarboxylase [Pluralibacter gergoviae]|uniref:3-dehydro-L-gulonate-6-phosphate decarboxylase n=1 Tax=Pluralibacter gergoviae TaxID=61647 RepID=A0A089PIC4_PLUGE|nr:3-hexulose-6-phosphate synthase [Pluralibacter gergoviae]AIR00017.1 3-hexulose-6-phosphate synthase [Pluralibacter gergoviae]EKT9640957.1 orotidine 5'-phosphate decarboxylase [Pluralibacter gergoviae]EKV0915555.1 orotidine 5'-phosphate decarboxylase [Pluralibacter gergoviae]EKV0929287.1 orotidine 5'-phosphate decarboxylase [Pluralibacter gergoviae]EKV3543564.1 orotidine 5'-phosphate decarboxylase [Pluralibacter gergoviae]
MKLQVALDLLSTDDAVNLLNDIAPYVDIIEVGTPLIKIEGLAVLREIKSRWPDKFLFADLKTMDAGALEAELALNAGADAVSVLAVAADGTIAGAVNAANKLGKSVVVDLIGVPPTHRLARIDELRKLGVGTVELHAGLDEQAQEGYSLPALLATIAGTDVKFAVAGGITLDTVDIVAAAGAETAVVGGGIYNAANPAATAKSLKEKLLQLA